MMSWQQSRSRLGNLERTYRDRGNRPPEVQKEIDDLRASLRAHKLEQHIRETVDAAPPLSAEQRTRLAALLAPGVANACSSRGAETAT